MPRASVGFAWIVVALGVAPWASAAPAERMAAIPSPVNTSLPGVRTADAWSEKTTAAAPRDPAPLALSPIKSTASPTLRPPTRSSASGGDGKPASPAVWTVLGSLGVVLGLFLAVMWLMRRGLPAGAPPLPKDVVEVLGRAPLANRQHMHLVRWGNKLLLINVTAGGAESLAEISDPAEVDRLAGMCREAHPQSATVSFKHMFQQLSRTTGRKGLADTEATRPQNPATGANRAAEGRHG